jgi:SAM-dependent methyltransferase
MPVAEWPLRSNVVGYGVSDWPNFTAYIAKKLDYRNTQYDEALRGDRLFLDITAPPPDWIGTADFVTCSEVLEHVVPPVERAFNGLFSLLKPGGALIFSVPYWFQKTDEHFPDLHSWTIQERNGVRTLVNKTASGELQIFTDLCFHGGGAAVLEMRLFGYDDLLQQLMRAGFDRIESVENEYLPYGIRFAEPWSLPMIARKPRALRG